jgi:hypothetical protein
LKRSEATAISQEGAARSLFHAGAREIDLAALDAIIARKQVAAEWFRRRSWRSSAYPLASMAVAAVGGFAIVLQVLGAGLDPRTWYGDPRVGAAISVGMVAGVVGAVVAFMRASDVRDPDLAFALRLRSAILREDEDLKRLRARANGGGTFALYLRTFATEAHAQTYREAADDALRGIPPIAVASESDGLWAIDQMDKHTQATLKQVKSEWEFHLRIIDTIGRFAPVICLGNLFLQHEKLADLRRLGVDQVTFVRADWWPVLVEFADRATHVVVFVSAATASVDMELTHLVESGRSFVLVSSQATHQRMSVSTAYRNALAASGVTHVVLEDEDVAPLEMALRGR